MDTKSKKVYNEDIIELLGDIADSRATPSLKQMITNQIDSREDYWLAYKAIAALAGMRCKASFDVLRFALNSDDDEIVELAKEALKQYE